MGTVVAKRAVLRTGPSRNNIRISVLDHGELVPVEYSRGGWTRVKTLSGLRAWVNSETLSVVRYR